MKQGEPVTCPKGRAKGHPHSTTPSRGSGLGPCICCTVCICLYACTAKVVCVVHGCRAGDEDASMVVAPLMFPLGWVKPKFPRCRISSRQVKQSRLGLLRLRLHQSSTLGLAFPSPFKNHIQQPKQMRAQGAHQHTRICVNAHRHQDEEGCSIQQIAHNAQNV